MTPRRGDVWLIDFGEPVGREQAGRRPGVVVSSDLHNEGPSGVLIVVPVTTTYRGLLLHVEIEPDGSGLHEVSYARCEDIKSISERRFIMRFGMVHPHVLDEIGRTMRFLLEL